MNEKSTSHRYVFQTQGVCPPEIHFRIRDNFLESVRFVGGGCPGNAELVGRLVSGRPVDEVLAILSGIACRNDTSCPDQLATALTAAGSGDLSPAASFQVANDETPLSRLGILGSPMGDPKAVAAIADDMAAKRVDTTVCLGNMTGTGDGLKDLIRTIEQRSMLPVQGDADWRHANGTALPPRDRDWLLRLPQVRTFRLDGRLCMVFYGDHIQRLPGYSDYEPFALEMNMVCGLTDFMRDASVFPALSAMLPQFTADIVVFAQTGRWGNWAVDAKEFVSIGPAAADDGYRWGLLEMSSDRFTFTVRHVV